MEWRTDRLRDVHRLFGVIRGGRVRVLAQSANTVCEAPQQRSAARRVVTLAELRVRSRLEQQQPLRCCRARL